jgi:hypothetical protein
MGQRLKRAITGREHMQQDAVHGRQSYSITSSARASSVGGTSRANAFAVFRLMTRFEPTRSLDGDIACLGTTRLG